MFAQILGDNNEHCVVNYEVILDFQESWIDSIPANTMVKYFCELSRTFKQGKLVKVSSKDLLTCASLSLYFFSRNEKFFCDG